MFSAWWRCLGKRVLACLACQCVGVRVPEADLTFRCLGVLKETRKEPPAVHVDDWKVSVRGNGVVWIFAPCPGVPEVNGHA